MKLSVEAFPKSPNILGSQKEDLLGCGFALWNFHSGNILFSTRFAGIFWLDFFQYQTDLLYFQDFKYFFNIPSLVLLLLYFMLYLTLKHC